MKKKKASHLGVRPFSGQGYSFISHAFSSYFPMYLIANVSHTQVKDWLYTGIKHYTDSSTGEGEGLLSHSY